MNHIKTAMKQSIVLSMVLFFSVITLHSQKKQDLLDEIDKLRTEIKAKESELSNSRKKEKAAQGQIEGMKTQLEDLKQTNASLLGNMSSFTELSNKKAKNLETSLQSLKEKDEQIKTINDAISRSDSVKLATLTILKNAIGDGNIGVKNGTVIISIPNTKLFGASDKSTTIDAGAKTLLGKIATVFNTKPDLKLIVEGNSNALNLKDKGTADNWDPVSYTHLTLPTTSRV